MKPHRFPNVAVRETGRESFLVTVELDENRLPVFFREQNPFQCPLSAAMICGVEQVTSSGPGRGGWTDIPTSITALSHLVQPHRSYLGACPESTVMAARSAESGFPGTCTVLADGQTPEQGSISLFFKRVSPPDIEAELLRFAELLQASSTEESSVCLLVDSGGSETFAEVVKAGRSIGLKPLEQLTLEPFFKDHAVIVWTCRLDNIVGSHLVKAAGRPSQKGDTGT
mmetsp:Transcript_8568/g.20245  ORF Transcript_8568/g.20245 Transcript_8568/m.20245 type:complete len:227 (-) Transcript_8568:41-721(-)